MGRGPVQTSFPQRMTEKTISLPCRCVPAGLAQAHCFRNLRLMGGAASVHMAHYRHLGLTVGGSFSSRWLPVRVLVKC